MSRLNFFIGLLFGAIAGWLGDMFFGRTTLENQVSALRAERVVVQGQLKDAERVIETKSAEIAGLKTKLTATASKPAAAKPTPKPKPAAPQASVKLASANGSDNLRLIEGIGPKASAVLADAGVTSFAQMATMDGDALMTILKTAKLRGKFYTDSWSEQAAIAATGDLEALTKLQAELVGGRRVS